MIWPQPARAELRRADLGPDVAEEVGQPVVDLQGIEHVPPLLAPVDHLDHGEAHALAPDVVGRDVVPAGDGAARVAVVALDRADEDHPPVAGLVGREHGGEHVVVGQVPAAVVRVVGDEHVALAELVDAEEVEREAHREGRRQHELRDADAQRREPAAGVEHGRVALVRLVEDRRGRGAAHVRGHLEAHRLHAAADDLRGDDVDLRIIEGPRSGLGELDEVDGHRSPLVAVVAG